MGDCKGAFTAQCQARAVAARLQLDGDEWLQLQPKGDRPQVSATTMIATRQATKSTTNKPI